jgi:hypothetical protein
MEINNFRIKKNTNVNRSLKNSQKQPDTKFMNFTMKHNFRNSIDSKKSDNEVRIATPEKQSQYDGITMGEQQNNDIEKLSTIVESPNIIKETASKRKASIDIRPMRISSTETKSIKQIKKIVLKKLNIKEIDKKLQIMEKVKEEHPQLEITASDITIDPEVVKSSETTKNSDFMMKITGNTISVSYERVYLFSRKQNLSIWTSS